MASLIDLVGIKEDIQTHLQSVNTTTADNDLSANLGNNRVNTIMKVNPVAIRPQANDYPLVTIFYDSMDIVNATIAKNQVQGRREATIDLKIVGMSYNTSFSNFDEDPADDDVEYLMQNIERNLRDLPTVNDKISVGFPTAVTFHGAPYDEDTHIRAGIMNYQLSVKSY